jgi:hypothetical protein
MHTSVEVVLLITCLSNSRFSKARAVASFPWVATAAFVNSNRPDFLFDVFATGPCLVVT